MVSSKHEKHKVFRDKDISAFITIDSGICCFHLYVYSNVNKKLLKKCYEVFIETCMYLDSVGYERVYLRTESERFCRLCGLTSMRPLGDANGVPLFVVEFEDVIYV